MKPPHFTAVRLLIWVIPGIAFGFYANARWRIPFILSLISLAILGMLHFRIPEYGFRALPRLLQGLQDLVGIIRAQRRGRAIRCIFSCLRQKKDAAAIPNAKISPLGRLSQRERQRRFPLASWQPFTKTIFGIVVFIAVFSTGWLSVTLHQQKNQPRHYTSYADPATENTISFRIRKTLRPNAFYHRYEAKIFSINHKKASGKILLNIRKDSTSQPLKADARYKAKTLLREIMPPLNPHQFHYKHYLEKQHIHHQAYIQLQALYPLPEAGTSLRGMAASLRENINIALTKQGFQGDELAVINALLLGQRRDISNEVYTSYADAGAIHILAVSGLHVGIILLLLNVTLKPLERLPHGKKLKLLLILLLLWAFALLAGLSASVVRAVTMFSFVAWAMQLKRTSNIYNILAVSMLFLLLLKPLFLFDVGFQLSYTAVFAIVWLQPMLYKLWKPRRKIPDFFWKILTVTLAAQCGVAPLSLYYFHQFPGLFFVSNLVIIPVLGFVLGFGIILILLALLNMLPAFLADAYEYIIGLMNGFIHWVAQQQAFIVRDIPFDGPFLFFMYLTLTSAVLAFKKPVFRRLVFFLAAVIMLQGALIFNRRTSETKHQLIIFHKNRHTLIGAKTGTEMKLYATDEKLMKDNTIKNYSIGERIDAVERQELKNVYAIREKVLLRVDSLGIYAVPGLQPDYVLLCDSPEIHLERLISELRPAAVIADGSNYKSDIERWKASCKAQKIPFHATGEKGAFIIGDH